MNIFNHIPLFRNRKAGKKQDKRITEGGNFSPGATVVLSAPRRFGLGLDDYMMAIRDAENVDYPRRVRLYDLYNDILLDPHLFAVVQKRKSGVLGRKILFRRNGQDDDKVNEQLASPWFLRFVEDALDAQLWGFSLMQFFVNKQGWMDYYLVPRKHVDLQNGTIRHRQENLTGEPFDNFSDLLLVNGKEPLGILARTAPYVIYKRGTMGDWSQYAELFGMPVRKYTYDAADPAAREATISDAMEQGGGSVFLCPDGTNLEFIESGNKTGSSDLYSTFVERCNAEISKAVVGNTLTTEASETGTQALGTVHRQVEAELSEQDGLFVLNLLNYEMTDIFASLGIDTRGGSFVFAEEEELGLLQKADLFAKARLNLHLPISDDYLYEQLKIEKPDSYAQLVQRMEEGRMQDDRPDNQPQNRARSRFFVPAPGSGALEW